MTSATDVEFLLSLRMVAQPEGVVSPGLNSPKLSP